MTIGYENINTEIKNRNLSKKTEINKLCPICNKKGEFVKSITVKHLVNDELKKIVNDKLYFICMNENCEVVYYNNESSTIFNKNQVKVPIWFKKDADPKYACYCSKVTEIQVKDAVLNYGATTVKDINEITGAMKICQCEKENPLGKCCSPIIKEIIDKTLKNK